MFCKTFWHRSALAAFIMIASHETAIAREDVLFRAGSITTESYSKKDHVKREYQLVLSSAVINRIFAKRTKTVWLELPHRRARFHVVRISRQSVALRDREGSTAFLSRHAGGVVGTIYDISGTYRIERSGRSSKSVLHEIDSSSFVEGKDYEEPPEWRTEGKVEALKECNSPLPVPPGPGKGTRIRVLVAYTPAAAAARTNIDADIDALMLELDVVASTLPDPVIMVLAGKLQTAQGEIGNSSQDLEALSKPNDGRFDEALQQRVLAQADLVVLLTQTMNDACGRAYLLENPAANPSGVVPAYAVVRLDCALTNLSFSHEVGHLLGMRHDRAVESNDPSKFNYGYVAHARKVRTVMAYNDACSAKGYDCKRVAIYSNPRQMIKDTPLGVELGRPGAAYNIEALCKNAGSISKYRPR